MNELDYLLATIDTMLGSDKYQIDLYYESPNWHISYDKYSTQEKDLIKLLKGFIAYFQAINYAELKKDE